MRINVRSASRLLWAALAAVALATIPATASAQPEMGGLPPGMLGRPLPSPDLPRGVLTVRVIGNAIDDIKPGKVVELARLEGDRPIKVSETKTGDDGRARFEGLQAGVGYLAILHEGAKRIQSHPFGGPPEGGIKMMLSTSGGAAAAEEGDDSGEGGTEGEVLATSNDPHAGIAGAPTLSGQTGAAELTPAPELPTGTLEVIVVRGGAKDQPVAGATVIVHRGDAAVERKTDATGKISLTADKDLRAGGKAKQATSGELEAEVHYDNTKYRSDRVSLPEKGGARLTFTVYGRTTNTDQLMIGPGSFILGQLGEQRIGCLQAFALFNRGSKLIDLGHKGLRLPLPNGSINPGVPEAMQKIASIDESGRFLVVKGQLPPGRLTVQAFYELPHETDSLDFHQAMPIENGGSLFALENAPNIQLGGPAFQAREVRKHAGTETLVFTLGPVKRGGALEFTVLNLPHEDDTAQIAVIVVAAVILLWAAFAIGSARRRHDAQRRQRETLLEQLVQLEREHSSLDAGATKPATKTYQQRRRALVEQLREVWS